MFGLSPFEIAIVALLIVLLFGARRLPELGTGIGQAISNFKKSYKDGQAIDITSSNKNAETDSEKINSNQSEQKRDSSK
ncbi:MAG TPA: twin-arginine translocase TatA/TatE family subunit [Oligoflexia bacterium]|nr:twin-arginine translocase TatA/TatE family subunit [Oligoflexia bacterium]HMP26561.1 twin-arginine translocase TatA/TatE family subunit [Oligoflexia bacterium]